MYIILLVIMLMTTYDCCLLDFLIYYDVKEGGKETSLARKHRQFGPVNVNMKAWA